MTDSTFEIGVKGLMFDSAIGEEEPAITIPVMPYHDIYKSQKYQAYVSAYSIDGFASSLIEVFDVAGTIRNDMLPENLQSILTTSTLNLLLPGIQKYYGDLPMNVAFAVTKLGDFGVESENTLMSGKSSLDLQFYVVKEDGTEEMACDLQLNDIEFGFTASVDNMNITLDISTVKIDQVVVVSDTFGRLSPTIIKTALNTGFAIALPVVNNLLADHSIPFPSNIAGLFELSDLVLDYYDGYIYAGATPTFIAPSAEPELELSTLFTQ